MNLDYIICSNNIAYVKLEEKFARIICYENIDYIRIELFWDCYFTVAPGKFGEISDLPVRSVYNEDLINFVKRLFTVCLFSLVDENKKPIKKFCTWVEFLMFVSYNSRWNYQVFDTIKDWVFLENNTEMQIIDISSLM